MSGFKISKPSPDILPKSSPEGVTTSKSIEKLTPEGSPKLTPETGTKLSPTPPTTSSGKTPTLDHSETLVRVHQEVGKTPSQDLRTTQRRVPELSELQKAQQKIMGKALESGSYQPQTETIDKTLSAAKAEYLKDTELLSENMGDSSVSLKGSSFFDEEVSGKTTDFVKALQVYAPSGRTEDRLKDYLKEQMGKELKALSKVDRAKYKTPEQKESALKTATQSASNRLRDMLRDYAAQHELPILLNSRSELELKILFAEIVGEARHGKPLAYDKLSPKKQAFVDGMLAGTRNGLKMMIAKPQPYFPSLEDSELTRAAGDLSQAFRNRVHQLSQAQMQKLSLMSDTEIKAMLATEIGQSKAVLDIALSAIKMELNRAILALDTTPRTAPKVVESFKPEMLLDETVASKLESLKTDLSNPEAQSEFIGALKTFVSSLPETHNAKWHLGTLSLSATAQLLQSYAPGLTDEDALAMAKELKTALPVTYGEERFTETVTTGMITTEIKIPRVIQIEGKSYELDKRLAVAGNGAVYRYVNPEAPDDRLAIKINVGEMDREAILKEIDLHRELMGPTGDSDKVGQLKGISTLEDGSLIMVQEYLSGGELTSPRDHFRRALDEGLISQEAFDKLNLYLLKGILEAMDFMHSDREMIHLDVKLQNMMLGSDGKVKLIDFGTSELGTALSSSKRVVDSVFNRAPERMASGVMRKSKESDTWSVGVMAYELLKGSYFEHELMSHKFEVGKEKAVKQFAMDTDNRITTHGKVEKDGVSHSGLGVSAKDKLLNSLMMGQSDQRVTLQTALKSSLMTDSSLTHPKMLELFQKLSTVPPVDEPATDLDKTRALIEHITPELEHMGLM